MRYSSFVRTIDAVGVRGAELLFRDITSSHRVRELLMTSDGVHGEFANFLSILEFAMDTSMSEVYQAKSAH